MTLNQRPTREFDETYGDRVKEKEARILLNDYSGEGEDTFNEASEENPHHQPLPKGYARSVDMESLTMSNSSREPRRKTLPVRTPQQVLTIWSWWRRDVRTDDRVDGDTYTEQKKYAYCRKNKWFISDRFTDCHVNGFAFEIKRRLSMILIYHSSKSLYRREA